MALQILIALNKDLEQQNSLQVLHWEDTERREASPSLKDFRDKCIPDLVDNYKFKLDSKNSHENEAKKITLICSKPDMNLKLKED